jgi:hypothetical protein
LESGGDNGSDTHHPYCGSFCERAFEDTHKKYRTV